MLTAAGRSLFLPQVTVVLSVRLWLMGGSMPLFSEQDNPASFSPHLLTRLCPHAHASGIPENEKLFLKSKFNYCQNIYFKRLFIHSCPTTRRGQRKMRTTESDVAFGAETLHLSFIMSLVAVVFHLHRFPVPGFVAPILLMVIFILIVTPVSRYGLSVLVKVCVCSCLHQLMVSTH